LTYNLSVSTNTAVVGIGVTAPFRGNVGRPPVLTGKHTWKLKLPSGTYWWSVQTVDSGYKRSTWAAKQSSSYLDYHLGQNI